MLSSVLGFDFAVLRALVPERVFGVSREEIGFDLIVQDVVPLSIFALLTSGVFDGDERDLSV